MPKAVSMGAQLQCTMGTTPTSLIVLPINKATSTFMPVATVNDMISIVNIPTFGMCQSPSNPTVAAATAAALGVLTPMPCIPVVAGPWSPGSANTTLCGAKALTEDSKCTCSWAGSISINSSGQTKMTC